MGKSTKDQIQLVISHLEGCAGNFLGRLAADWHLDTEPLFRTDLKQHEISLSTNQCSESEMLQLDQHCIIVTHNFDQQYLRKHFPRAKFISIYPYDHVGNVLYNICLKKNTITITNIVDNYICQIKDWHCYIEKKSPTFECTNYWDLRCPDKVENLLGITFSQTQQQFFDNYWKKQLHYELDIPKVPTTIGQLITDWKIENYFNDWAVAWTIYVFELIHNLPEQSRTWSIDVDVFESWQDLEKIQTRYNRPLTTTTN
jgi:hypothetical protein